MKPSSRIATTALALLISILLSGCESFRPRGYQPPTDSYEYIAKRDGLDRPKGADPKLSWMGDLAVGLLNALAHSGR
jgi:hypothetical protein